MASKKSTSSSKGHKGLLLDKPALKKSGKAGIAAKKPGKVTKPVKKAIVSKSVSKKAVTKTASLAVKNVAKAAPAKPAPEKAVAIPTIIKPAVVQIPVIKEPQKQVRVPKTSTSISVKYEPAFTKSVLDLPGNEKIGPTMRYADKELAEFKDLIFKKLDAARRELSYLHGLITRKDESGEMEDARYMTMEDGGISMEREQLSQMASRQIQFIDHLEKAIMRIENKTYGICRVTGKLIEKARLRAVPHATLSIEAKQMMNK